MITFFTPKASCAGRVLVIHGENFVDVISVTIGGIQAKFKVLNTRTIRAIVPAGFDGGRITVTTAAGAATTKHAVKKKCPGSD